ncbi:MAG: hypothetical protein BJ554DRAFT_679 [Olpidium bornovanus]|uniref:Uncharacterized protein n=1 Tax=Olpidium bornovanus TaxID=278681 RepID=A0A8H7ZT07_9FUNG|nr:MAG: hypothetical protein BJ554DRAFT_679 [Olpidium bornovanus]
MGTMHRRLRSNSLSTSSVTKELPEYIVTVVTEDRRSKTEGRRPSSPSSPSSPSLPGPPDSEYSTLERPERGEPSVIWLSSAEGGRRAGGGGGKGRGGELCNEDKGGGIFLQGGNQGPRGSGRQRDHGRGPESRRRGRLGELVEGKRGQVGAAA